MDCYSFTFLNVILKFSPCPSLNTPRMLHTPPHFSENFCACSLASALEGLRGHILYFDAYNPWNGIKTLLNACNRHSVFTAPGRSHSSIPTSPLLGIRYSLRGWTSLPRKGGHRPAAFAPVLLFEGRQDLLDG